MKPKFFSKSLKILIITLLLLAVLFNKSLSQKLMLAAILIWIGGTLCFLFGGRLSAFIKSMYMHWSAVERTPLFHAEKNCNDEKETVLEPLPCAAPAAPVTHTSENRRMLQHISLRITEKLKSAYPDATWQWEEKPDLTAILEGKTFRIMTDGMEKFTHADVHFDQYARIRITPLIVGEFSSAAETVSAQEADNDGTTEPPVVDVNSWYELIGRDVLDNIITELNANGHTRLAVKENGDIVISRNKKDTLKGTLEQFPPKNYWKEFLQLLEEYELHGKEEKDRIIISWT